MKTFLNVVGLLVVALALLGPALNINAGPTAVVLIGGALCLGLAKVIELLETQNQPRAPRKTSVEQDALK